MLTAVAIVLIGSGALFAAVRLYFAERNVRRLTQRIDTMTKVVVDGQSARLLTGTPDDEARKSSLAALLRLSQGMFVHDRADFLIEHPLWKTMTLEEAEPFVDLIWPHERERALRSLRAPR